MAIRIQKPSIGRVVEYRGRGGPEQKQPGVIVFVYEGGFIDLRNLTTLELCEYIRHDADGDASGTWRYPPMVREEVEVDR